MLYVHKSNDERRMEEHYSDIVIKPPNINLLINTSTERHGRKTQ